MYDGPYVNSRYDLLAGGVICSTKTCLHRARRTMGFFLLQGEIWVTGWEKYGYPNLFFNELGACHTVYIGFVYLCFFRPCKVSMLLCAS